MRRFFSLLALLVLVACTGTQGDHDPVALVVATKDGTTTRLQLVETRSLSLGDGLVLHDDFTYTYGTGVNIVQLLSPDTQRRELWVLYTQGGTMFIDVFAMSEVSLAQPAALQPTRTINLGLGTPDGFDVYGTEIAVMAAGDLLLFDSVSGAPLPSLITTPIQPVALPPVFLGSRLYYWSDGLNNEVELVAAAGSFERISFGASGAPKPVIARDIFERDRIVHLGSNSEITLYDRALGENPVRVKLDDLQGSQSAHVYGGRLLSVASTLQQVAMGTSGDELTAKLVGKDNISGSIIVPDPYNQYAYALRAGRGTMINTLLDPNSEPDDRHVLPGGRDVPLHNLATPTAGEAFIIQGAP